MLANGVEDRKTARVNLPALQEWVPNRKRKTRLRFYARACPGVNGKPCKYNRHLRKDSVGGLCGDCREQLVRADRVPAERAYQHLIFLSQNGVGTTTVQHASDVSKSTLQGIRRQRGTLIARTTEERILAVTPDIRTDGHLVDAKETWEHLEWLQTYGGMSKARIAFRLGYTTPALQMRKDKVLMRTAQKVRKLRTKIEAELKADHIYPYREASQMVQSILAQGVKARVVAKYLGWDNLVLHRYDGKVSKQAYEELKSALWYFTGEGGERQDDICADCGYSHSPDSRQALIRRMLPATSKDIWSEFTCLYPSENRREAFESRKLIRDLHSLGAVKLDGSWHIPEKADG